MRFAILMMTNVFGKRASDAKKAKLRGRQRGRNFKFNSSCIIFVECITTTSHHGDSTTDSNAGAGRYMSVGLLLISGLWTCEARTTVQDHGPGAPS